MEGGGEKYKIISHLPVPLLFPLLLGGIKGGGGIASAASFL